MEDTSVAKNSESAESHGSHNHGRAADHLMDELHEKIKFYLGGKLSLAPLEGFSPKSILEMGSGSGAWAIQAAELFPEVDVHAIDLSPLPPRSLPPNLRFEIHDMTKPFPFGSQTFDIVHSRFVFHHLPGFEDVLNRTMQLVKPGGWLLLDEGETVLKDDAGLPSQNAMKEFQQLIMGKDSNPYVGSALQAILESSGVFSEVNVRKIPLPISKCDEAQMDIGVRPIAESFRWMMRRVLQSLKDKNSLSLEVIKAVEEEINDPSRDMQMEIYMTWSRKRN